MRALTQRVYARVRPPAASELRLLSENAAQERFKLLLYRSGRVALLLPAAVFSAVVADGKFKIPHSDAHPRLQFRPAQGILQEILTLADTLDYNS